MLDQLGTYVSYKFVLFDWTTHFSYCEFSVIILVNVFIFIMAKSFVLVSFPEDAEVFILVTVFETLLQMWELIV